MNPCYDLDTRGRLDLSVDPSEQSEDLFMTRDLVGEEFKDPKKARRSDVKYDCSVTVSVLTTWSDFVSGF